MQEAVAKLGPNSVGRGGHSSSQPDQESTFQALVWVVARLCFLFASAGLLGATSLEDGPALDHWAFH